MLISLKKSSSLNKFNTKTKLTVISKTNSREVRKDKVRNFV